MDIKDKLKYSAFAFCTTYMALAPIESQAFLDDSPVQVTCVTNTPTLDTPTPMSFGAQYMAVSKVGSTATQTISPAGALTSVPGAPGAARLIPVDTTGKTALSFTVTGGIAGALMSLQIGNDTGGVQVVLTGATTPTDATFKLDTWTATASAGTLTTAVSATTGLGQVTLSGTGTATIAFGAKLSTDNSGNPYSAQNYDGVIRVQVAY